MQIYQKLCARMFWCNATRRSIDPGINSWISHSLRWTKIKNRLMNFALVVTCHVMLTCLYMPANMINSLSTTSCKPDRQSKTERNYENEKFEQRHSKKADSQWTHHMNHRPLFPFGFQWFVTRLAMIGRSIVVIGRPYMFSDLWFIHRYKALHIPPPLELFCPNRDHVMGEIVFGGCCLCKSTASDRHDGLTEYN